MNYRRFVAVGDSCTEGIDDPHPDGEGFRGWADLVAERLASTQPELHYANLAVRGRRLDQILAEQVPLALELRPDLASVFGGGNDVLQGRWDPDVVAASLDDAVRALSGVARTVLMFALPDFSGLMPLKRMGSRIAALNAAVRETAERYGAVLVDLRDDQAARDRRYLGADRLHLGTRGHQLLAAHVLNRLEVPTAQEWLVPLPDLDQEPRWRRISDDLSWLRRHVAPAVYSTMRNRMIGRQPGDGLVPKRPELSPVVPVLRAARALSPD